MSPSVDPQAFPGVAFHGMMPVERVRNRTRVVMGQIYNTRVASVQEQRPNAMIKRFYDRGHSKRSGYRRCGYKLQNSWSVGALEIGHNPHLITLTHTN